MTKQLRVSGHTLISEGARHDKFGDRINIYHPGWTSPWGHGKCSCGALSDFFKTKAARKQWHAHHKLAIITEQRNES